MGFKNYVSVYRNGCCLSKNYDRSTDHPYKNNFYSILFDDEASKLKHEVSVRVRSCENRIYFLMSTTKLENLHYRFEDNEDTEEQYFYFTPNQGDEVLFIENQYIDDYEELLFNDVCHRQMSVKSQKIKLKKYSDHFGVFYRVTSNNVTLVYERRHY